MAGIILAALFLCGAITYFLYNYREEAMWKRQVRHRINILKTSAVSRLGAPMTVNDYDEVDRIMTDLFGYEEMVVEALIVDLRNGTVYYDLTGGREGKNFNKIELPAGLQYNDKKISLQGGFGFIVPETKPIGRLIIGYEYSDTTRLLQKTSLKDYSRALINDINKKLNSNYIETARITLGNLCAESKRVKYFQWLDNEGRIFAHVYQDGSGELRRGDEGGIADDPLAEMALTVRKRRPMLVQPATDPAGRQVYDIAMPLIRNGEKIGVLRLGFSTENFRDIEKRSKTIMAVAIVIFILSAFVLAAMASYLVGYPLNRLAGLVRDVGRGEPERFGEVQTNIKEVDSLVNDFESMTRNIRKAEQEKEAIQEQLYQSQKMESIGLLAGGIAHDFNNILTIILGNASMLQRKLSNDDNASLMLSEIINSSERARDLTMKLLTFSRKDRINVRPYSIDEIIDNVIQIMQRSLLKTSNIARNIEPGLSIEVDKNQITQALLNVCQNALDAMPEGGEITIEGYRVQPDKPIPELNAEQAGTGCCCIKISDSGPGIDSESLSRIFDPFFTTKPREKGTGLGLSVTQGIVQSHRGSIHVESSPGAGTVFYIYLPLAETETAPASEEMEAKEWAAGNETVLVVDDEKMVLDLTSRILESTGYTALRAENGSAALDIFNRNSPDISLVVLDMVMPGMKGRDVFFELRKIDPGIRILLASGYTNESSIEDLLEHKNASFLQKPFDPDVLCATVRNLLDG